MPTPHIHHTFTTSIHSLRRRFKRRGLPNYRAEGGAEEGAETITVDDNSEAAAGGELGEGEEWDAGEGGDDRSVCDSEAGSKRGAKQKRGPTQAAALDSK